MRTKQVVEGYICFSIIQINDGHSGIVVVKVFYKYFHSPEINILRHTGNQTGGSYKNIAGISGVALAFVFIFSLLGCLGSFISAIDFCL